MVGQRPFFISVWLNNTPVVNLGLMLRQGEPQRGQGQRLVQVTIRSQPRMARLSTSIKTARYTNSWRKMDVRDIPSPHLARPDNRQLVPQIPVSSGGMSPPRRPTGSAQGVARRVPARP